LFYVDGLEEIPESEEASTPRSAEKGGASSRLVKSSSEGKNIVREHVFDVA
jgi:hypothetical protein